LLPTYRLTVFFSIGGLKKLNKQEWVAIKKGAVPNQPSLKAVKVSGLQKLMNIKVDKLTRQSTQVVYEASGVWKGNIQKAKATYDVVSAPQAGLSSEEGAPQIPQEGLFVAIPNGASNVSVKMVNKSMEPASGKFNLPPAPKAISESAYVAGKEEYKPKSSVYGSDKDYPGKDFDFIGVKNIDGIPVAQLLLYLAQYKPLSKTLSYLKSITLEVSYDVPPQNDAVPIKKLAPTAMQSIILDKENVKSPTDTVVNSVISATNPSSAYFVNSWGLTKTTTGSLYDPAKNIFEKIPPGPLHLIRLKKTNISSQYVIVGPEAVRTSVDPLIQAKAGSPYNAMFAATEDITIEFPAPTLKESIRAFLVWAWDNWQVPPKYVVLAGDTDTIPVHVGQIGTWPFVSDHYYADIKDSEAPELVVSRLPTSDATKLQQICQHLASYANLRGPDWGSWQNEVLMVAYELNTYKDCSDDIASTISPRFTVTKRYGDSSTKQQVIDELNQGIVIANYRGHGSKIAWSSKNGISTQDISSLNNGNMPPAVFCICCENAWIDDTGVETVVESFLRQRKAVTLFGASRDSPTYANNDFDKYLFQAIMDGATTPGEIVQRAKTQMILNHPTSDEHRADVAMYLLFGDPTARVVSDVEFLRGKWNMDHDGWQGTLEINSISNHQIIRDGNYGYPVWDIAGTYSASGKQYAMTGRIGGKDTNDYNAGAKRSDHKVEFTVSFDSAAPQKFTGYVTTWTRNTLAGFTWWANRPFCWYAKKQ
jgi:hypothetical protein